MLPRRRNRRQHEAIVHLVIYGWPNYKLLPRQTGVRSPDLAFQVNSPFIIQRMVAEVHEPCIDVSILPALGVSAMNDAKRQEINQ